MMWLAIVAIVFAIIGLYYYLRVVKVMYFDEPADDAPLELPADLAFRWVLSINGLALLVLGIVLGTAARLVHARVRELSSSSGEAGSACGQRAGSGRRMTNAGVRNALKRRNASMHGSPCGIPPQPIPCSLG